MAFNITTTILPAGIGFYVKADASNPSTIDEGGNATLKFYADGTYYTLQKAVSSISVSGASIVSWTCAKPFTEGTLAINNPTGEVTLSVTAKVGVIPQTVASPFKYLGKAPLDIRTVLSKAQMLDINIAQQPEIYFAVCSDDNKLYVFNKSFTADPTTGYFKTYEQFLEFAKLTQQFKDDLKEYVGGEEKNTLYKIVVVTEGVSWKLQKSEDGGETWTDVDGSVITVQPYTGEKGVKVSEDKKISLDPSTIESESIAQEKITGLAAKIETLESKDNILETAINNEATARSTADTTLQSNIEALDTSLAAIAKSGNVKDLIQDATDCLILQCNFE